MTGKRPLNDQDVVKLIGRLKSTRSEYPADLKSKRRTLFLNSAIGGAFLGVPKAFAAGHAVEAPMSTAMKVAIGFLTTSAIAVSASLGVLVYENRAALGNLLTGKTPTVVYSSPNPISTSTQVTSPESEIPSPTPELTPTPTLTLTSTLETQPVQQNATPVPNGNPGRHLGQTPHPNPTKDSPSH